MVFLDLLFIVFGWFIFIVFFEFLLCIVVEMYGWEYYMSNEID